MRKVLHNTRLRTLMALIMVFSLFFLMGTGYALAIDPELQLTGSNPANGAFDVYVDIPEITVTFSDGVWNLDESKVFLKDTTIDAPWPGQPVFTHYNASLRDSNTLVLELTQNLGLGAQYTLRLEGGALTYQGFFGPQGSPTYPDIIFNTQPQYYITLSANPEAGGTVSGGGAFDPGEVITVTATPDACHEFVSWTENDTVVSPNANYTFTVDGNRNLVANLKLKQFDVTVSANDPDGGTVGGGGTEIDCGTEITVTATANTGWYFVNWTENGVEVSSDPNYTFTVSDDHDLVANFTQITYTIGVSAYPLAGGTVDGGGVYPHCSNVTVTATANDGYRFVNWTENGVEVHDEEVYAFHASADRPSLVAEFVKTYDITVSANPAGSGTVTGGGTHDCGASVTVEAIEDNPCYEFVNWTENGVEIHDEKVYTFNADADRDLVANFKLKQFDVTVGAGVGGSASGGGIGIDCGTEITVTAAADPCYEFENWTESGTVVSTDADYTFNVTGDRDLVANFKLKQFDVTVTADPAAGGTVTGAGTYDCGESVIVTVDTVDPCYEFEKWTIGGVEVGADPAGYTFTVTGDTTVVANFELKVTDLLGDVNGDGVVDIQDVIWAVNISLGRPHPPEYFDRADVNNDGVVDILDVIAIVNLALGG